MFGGFAAAPDRCDRVFVLHPAISLQNTSRQNRDSRWKKLMEETRICYCRVGSVREEQCELILAHQEVELEIHDEGDEGGTGNPRRGR